MAEIMSVDIMTQKVIDAGAVITNKLRTYEDVIKTSVDIVNVKADLTYFLHVKQAEIGLRPELKDAANCKIKRLLECEYPEEMRLLQISRGYERTLKSLEYYESK